jgi:hypothetical protein
MRTSRFIRTIDFASLSLRDLLEARDQYHVHLANLDNVIGTAVGRYRIRDTDPDFNDPRGQPDPTDSEERTLGNSSVRKWSWPCVLVMVSHWQRKDEFRDRPGQFVPPRLYLPTVVWSRHASSTRRWTLSRLDQPPSWRFPPTSPAAAFRFSPTNKVRNESVPSAAW